MVIDHVRKIVSRESIGLWSGSYHPVLHSEPWYLRKSHRGMWFTLIRYSDEDAKVSCCQIGLSSCQPQTMLSPAIIFPSSEASLQESAALSEAVYASPCSTSFAYPPEAFLSLCTYVNHIHHPCPVLHREWDLSFSEYGKNDVQCSFHESLWSVSSILRIKSPPSCFAIKYVTRNVRRFLHASVLSDLVQILFLPFTHLYLLHFYLRHLFYYIFNYSALTRGCEPENGIHNKIASAIIPAISSVCSR